MRACAPRRRRWSCRAGRNGGAAVAAYYLAEQRGTTNLARFDARRNWPSPNFKGDLFAKADGFHVDYDIYSKALGDLADWLAA